MVQSTGSESEAASALSLDFISSQLEKIMGAKKEEEEMLRESDFQERARIILHCRILYCSKRVLGLFLFCGSTFLFPFVLTFVEHGYVCLLEPALRHLLLGLL